MRRPEVLLRFAGRFAVYFLPLAALWLVIAPFYSDLIFAGANLIFQLDKPPVARVSRAQGAIYAEHLTAGGAERVFEFKMYGLFFNAMLLFALLLASPGLSWKSRIQRVALAASTLVIIHVLFVVFQVKAEFINAGTLSVSSESAYWHNWLAAFFGALGEGLFPLLLAALFTWRSWASALQIRDIRISEPANALAIRNAPCPCGSGKKYKHCCGRA